MSLEKRESKRKGVKMYPEFIAIYIGLVVLILCAIFIIVLQIKILRNADTPKYFSGFGAAAEAQSQEKPKAEASVGYNNVANVVFCRNCAAKFEASKRNCPKCGMPR